MAPAACQSEPPPSWPPRPLHPPKPTPRTAAGAAWTRAACSCRPGTCRSRSRSGSPDRTCSRPPGSRGGPTRPRPACANVTCDWSKSQRIAYQHKELGAGARDRDLRDRLDAVVVAADAVDHDAVDRVDAALAEGVAADAGALDAGGLVAARVRDLGQLRGETSALRLSLAVHNPSDAPTAARPRARTRAGRRPSSGRRRGTCRSSTPSRTCRTRSACPGSTHSARAVVSATMRA